MWFTLVSLIPSCLSRTRDWPGDSEVTCLSRTPFGGHGRAGRLTLKEFDLSLVDENLRVLQ